METPFSGTALLLLIAGVLWLVYLVPIYLRRSEYLATERNAARLGQTLRVLAETAETTEELTTELSARDVARQQREAERKLREVSYGKDELRARRRRILRSTTTLFTAIGLVGLVSSIALQAALWVSLALGAMTLLGLMVLRAIDRAAHKARATAAPHSRPHTAAPARQAARTPRSWSPPALPEPLVTRHTMAREETPLPNREELLRQARAAALDARPEQAAAEEEQLAPVSQFDQMGRIEGHTPSATSSQVDLDEVLRRRRAV